MQNIKVIRTADSTLYIFYYSEGAISYQTINDNEVSESISVITNVSPVFSLWHSKNNIFLIANGSSGIILCRCNNGNWSSRAISSGISSDCTKLSFFVFEDLVHFLYSFKNDNGKETLTLRTMSKGQWLPPVEISEIMSFYNSPYYIGQEDDKNIIIYYRLPDKTIKYCTLSIDSGNLSSSISFLATNMPCIDISTLTDGTSGHLLYLAQGMFSTQLIYKGRNCDNLGKARIIWEGQHGRSCSLFTFENRLYVVLFTKNDAFLISSEENSSEFSIPKPFASSFSSSLTKSEYLSSCNSFPFNADEILINTQKLSFPIIDDICRSFSPPKSMKAAPVEKPQHNLLSDTDDYIKQLSSMNDQISQLSKTLSDRNEELASLSVRWKNKYDVLLKENEALKKQLSSQQPLPAPYGSNSDIIFVQSREL